MIQRKENVYCKKLVFHTDFYNNNSQWIQSWSSTAFNKNEKKESSNTHMMWMMVVSDSAWNKSEARDCVSLSVSTECC